MLYVGIRHDSGDWWRGTFSQVCGSPMIDILDINKSNLDHARNLPGIREFYLGDIRDFNAYPSGYDLLFWDGGPEHLPKEESLELLTRLIPRHKHVLIGCPWGFQPQETDPKSWEFHHWGPQPEDFEAIGMTAKSFGVMFTGGTVGGHAAGHGDVVAWT